MAEVLAKVQKEMGSEAKILNAHRARTGGIFGFFQREKFEVIVEVPDPAQATSSPPSNGGDDEIDVQRSILDLVQRISESEREQQSEIPPSGTSTARAPRSETAAPEAPASQSFGPGRETSGSETSRAETPKSEVIKADRVELPEDVPPPQISTQKDSFAEVLSRVAFQADMTTDPKSEEGAPVIDLEPTVEEVEENERESRLIEDRPAYLDVRPVASSPTPRSTPAFRTRISDHPLATLGLPVSFIPAGVDPTQLQKALAVSLERLPKPPEVRPSKGSIIAVVGEVVEAIELAQELAHKWKRPPEEVVLASQVYKGRGAEDVLRNVRSAEDARRSWSRRPRPTIVAIDAYPGSRETAWAEHMLTALEPIATYGVADATRKAEDIAAWASQLGGIDCLAVNHLEETVSPASILATGIPVERIDGRQATPAYWAMLLTERLTAA